jgi:hypothetical protein
MSNYSRRKKYFGTKCITINIKDDSDSTSAVLKRVKNMLKICLQHFSCSLVTVTAVSPLSLKIKNM